MRTVTRKVYQFSELPKKSQEKVVDEYNDINVDYDWWDMVYDDAAEVGISIKEFDVSYRQDIEIDLDYSPDEVAKMILEQHGEKCDTYKVAKEYLAARHVKQVALTLLGDDCDNPDCQNISDDIENLDEQFKKDIAQCYWDMLEQDYEYRQTSEAIIETIECNEYEFYRDGTRCDVVRRRQTA